MTAMNPFATIPSPSDGITWADVNGSLLIVQPTNVETGIQTSYGAADAVRANIWVIDGPNAGEVHDDTLVFPKLLQSQLKSRINQVVLGRLTQGQGKPGQSAPWLLAEPTAQDIQTGMQAWERIQAGGAAQAPQQTQQTPPAATALPVTQQTPPAAPGQFDNTPPF